MTTMNEKLGARFICYEEVVRMLDRSGPGVVREMAVGTASDPKNMLIRRASSKNIRQALDIALLKGGQKKCDP